MTREEAAGMEHSPVSVLPGNVWAPFLFVCEHASNHIPPQFKHLGLDESTRSSHIAWDPGAGMVTQHLREIFNATAVISRVSRLVYDCNRPPESPDAMPERSEIYDVPGNTNLSEKQKLQRVKAYYQPFKKALEKEIRGRNRSATLVTIHSFTPVYNGQRREVEIGILHDSDSRLADAMLKLSTRHTSLATRRNEPYGPEDGVTHTLRRHGVKNDLLNVMIEIRNDLLTSPSACKSMADMLSEWLVGALDICASTTDVAGTEKTAGFVR